MIRYLLQRILLGGATFLATLLVSYVLLRLAPGDPTRSTLLDASGSAANVSSDKGGFAVNEALRKELHLDKPLAVGFAYWFGNVLFHGDFGRSATVDPGRPVTVLIAERLPVTLSLNLYAILLAYAVAIPMGVFSAAKQGGWFDRSFEFLAFALYSLPVIWVGLLLQSWLCEGGRWPILPLKGIPAGTPLEVGIYEALWFSAKHYVLPILCLTYGSFAGLSRYMRNSMLENLSSEYIRTARAKGVPENLVVWRHAFRNSLITLITLFAGILPSLVAGSVIVEHIFNIPGMGTLSLLALSSRDYPLAMALFAFAGALTLSGILLADLLYLWADPRISFDSGGGRSL
ncbi:MAG: ABC transporter permease [Victivallaceae bacterium]|nr:ABC transporter permease [Victivallaceae bacterium]